jgi:hypothetical protein
MFCTLREYGSRRRAPLRRKQRARLRIRQRFGALTRSSPPHERPAAFAESPLVKEIDQEVTSQDAKRQE